MKPLPSSYRDAAGFVFEQEGTIYRLIQPGFQKQYDQFMQSGLYDSLLQKRYLIEHAEVENLWHNEYPASRILKPKQIPFISYPYEWSFTMWQDAALLHLKIASLALSKGMMIKDATPFNIQFVDGEPVFIDTLSFENYEEGKPWIAYRQFCECFLGPLLLMHHCHPEMGNLFAIYPNGIPLDVLVGLLPKKTKWHLHTFLHIHLQAKLKQGKLKSSKTENKFSQQKLNILLKGLEGFVKKLQLKKQKTTWDDYYSDTILGDDYLNEKTKLVNAFCANIEFETVIDLGANDGHFSLQFDKSKKLIATDADPNCINELYLKIKKEKVTNILPLLNNLVNPSPAIGWANAERESINSRFKADLVLALALVHHLSIANNIPLPMIADWLSSMGDYLMIEFVPKTDEKAKLLLQNREDIFNAYSIEEFKKVFKNSYQILKEEDVGYSNRTLFLMKRI